MNLKTNIKRTLAGITILKGLISLVSTMFVLMKYMTRDSLNLIDFITSIDDAIARITLIMAFLVSIEFLIKGLFDLNETTMEEINSSRKYH